MPIPGTTSLVRLEENSRACEVTLSAAELQNIDGASPHGVAAGTRYQASMMVLLNG